jgi:phosphoribosylformylglycinamidine cyclo-ligase
LLRPHSSYLADVTSLMEIERPAALAHITGGGIAGNLERVIPEHCTAVIDPATWELPAIFGLIERTGNVDPAEMYRVFNMGIGMIAVTNRNTARAFCGDNSGAFVIGEIRESSEGETRVEIQGIDVT